MPKAALNHAALPSLNGTRFDAALAVALEKGDVVSMDGVLSHATAGAAAHARAQERADAAFALLEGTLTPPFADGVTSSLNCTKSEAYAALGDLEEQGRAVKSTATSTTTPPYSTSLSKPCEPISKRRGPRWPPI